MAASELDDRGIVVMCPACGKRNRLVYARLGETVRCGHCKSELPPPSKPLDISSSPDFDKLIAQSPLPVVVDYWAPWCGPCRMVAPELEKVAARAANRFIVVKVNTDVLSDLGQRFGIRSIPTMAVFENGREVGRTTGARPAADIEQFVAKTTAAVIRKS